MDTESEKEGEGKTSVCNPYFLKTKERLQMKLVWGSCHEWSSVFDRLSYVWDIQVEMLNTYLEIIGLGFKRTVVRGAIGVWAVVETKEWRPCHAGRPGGMNEGKCWAKETSRVKRGDFPGSAVVKNPPANAGDTSSIPHAAGQLSHNYWACSLEPASHNYWSLCA